jgi:transmembrane sensor
MMDVRRDIPGDEPEADLEAQARAWIVRLKSGAATDQDLRRLAGWRAASPAAEAAFGRARGLWSMMGAALEADSQARVVPFRRPMLSRRGLLGAGVGGAIAAGAAGLVYLGGRSEIPAVPGETFVATAKGERRRIAVATGATADLNTASRARLWTADDLHGLDLLRGEAVVTIAEPPQRFIARVGHLTAAARNGEFLLRREGEAATILCLRGQVFAASGGERFTLKPRDLLLVDAAGARLALEHDLVDAASWRSGQLVYENRPLADVVDELNRYRKGRIVVRGEALAERRVSGVVQLDRIDGALTNFARSLGVGIARLPGGVVILG